MECTLQVLENMAPKAKLKPAIRSQARAVQMYGNAAADRKLIRSAQSWEEGVLQLPEATLS